MPTPLEATRHNDLTKLLVLPTLRANSKRTFQCETPCTQLKKKENRHRKNYLLKSAELRLACKSDEKALKYYSCKNHVKH